MPAVACFAEAHCSLSVTAYVRVLVEQDGTRYGMGRMDEEIPGVAPALNPFYLTGSNCLQVTVYC